MVSVSESRESGSGRTAADLRGVRGCFQGLPGLDGDVDGVNAWLDRLADTIMAEKTKTQVRQLAEAVWQLFTGRGFHHTGDIRRVIRSAGNLCLWHRL